MKDKSATKIFKTTFQNVKSNLGMKMIWAQLGLFPDKIYNFVFSDKKNKILKSLPTWVFVAPKCWQNLKILQLAWTLTPNKFWTKCLKMPDFCPNSIPIFHRNNKKTNFLASFYGWDSTTSRLESLQGGSLLFTTTFPQSPGTNFIYPKA